MLTIALISSSSSFDFFSSSFFSSSALVRPLPPRCAFRFFVDSLASQSSSAHTDSESASESPRRQRRLAGVVVARHQDERRQWDQLSQEGQTKESSHKENMKSAGMDRRRLALVVVC